MPHTTTVIIGAGQAGLAMSRCLTDRSIDHVILERGTVANSWSTQRWDSLRLLTPNWQSRLPGWQYGGPDPDGYMSMPEITDYLTAYAASFDAPVHQETTVLSVAASCGRRGFEIQTDQGQWTADTVVIATGACQTPVIPRAAQDLDPAIDQLAPTQYRNPHALQDGGVLVVGASASGIQIADELSQAGRDVTIAVGSHTRLPRMYRGMDVQWWLDGSGTLNERYDSVPDIERARAAPSLQIVGSPHRKSLDLASLAGRGVRLAGHLTGADGVNVQFRQDLQLSCRRADVRLQRILTRFDAYAASCGLDAEVDPPVRPGRFLPPVGPARLNLARSSVSTVVWATGFRASHPWLHVDVMDPSGHIRHDGGVVTGAPGMYVMGLPFMRRRKSTFIDGVGADAVDLSTHLAQHLEHAAIGV